MGEHPRRHDERRRWQPPTVRGLIYAAGLVATAATVTSLLARSFWLFDLTAHFRLQYVVVLVTAAIFGLAAKTRVAAAVFGVSALLNVFFVVPALQLSRASGALAPDVRILTANVSTENRAWHRLVDLIQSRKPELVVLTEVDQAWLDALKPISTAYPHTIVEPRSDNFGIAVWSRFPLEEGAIVRIGKAGLPSVLAKVATPRGHVWLLATHPLPPAGRLASELRNDQLAAIALLVDTLEGPTVVVGDLNVTPWSPHFRDLVAVAGLQRADRGLRSLYTWPTGFPILMLQLDHCLHSNRVESTGVEVLRTIESDHYPVMCGFRLE